MKKKAKDVKPHVDRLYKTQAGSPTQVFQAQMSNEVQFLRAPQPMPEWRKLLEICDQKQ